MRALPVFDCGAFFSALDAQRRDRGQPAAAFIHPAQR